MNVDSHTGDLWQQHYTTSVFERPLNMRIALHRIRPVTYNSFLIMQLHLYG